MEKYRQLLDEMELDIRQKANKMSSGMMAKLKIAATLARDSRLIMLDEPLNGIDIIAREKIINTIMASADGHRAFILSSHLTSPESECDLYLISFCKEILCSIHLGIQVVSLNVR